MIAKEIVIQAKSPSGTFATKIPIPKIMHCNALYFTTNKASKKKTIPKTIASIVIITTNLSNYVLNGVF